MNEAVLAVVATIVSVGAFAGSVAYVITHRIFRG